MIPVHCKHSDLSLGRPSRERERESDPESARDREREGEAEGEGEGEGRERVRNKQALYRKESGIEERGEQREGREKE